MTPEQVLRKLIGMVDIKYYLTPTEFKILVGVCKTKTKSAPVKPKLSK